MHIKQTTQHNIRWTSTYTNICRHLFTNKWAFGTYY